MNDRSPAHSCPFKGTSAGLQLLCSVGAIQVQLVPSSSSYLPFRPQRWNRSRWCCRRWAPLWALLLFHQVPVSSLLEMVAPEKAGKKSRQVVLNLKRKGKDLCASGRAGTSDIRAAWCLCRETVIWWNANLWLKCSILGVSWGTFYLTRIVLAVQLLQSPIFYFYMYVCVNNDIFQKALMAPCSRGLRISNPWWHSNLIVLTSSVENMPIFEIPFTCS